MGVVEVVPKSGVFDYTSKYTKGLTESIQTRHPLIFLAPST
jgi:hypothetical protein